MKSFSCPITRQRFKHSEVHYNAAGQLVKSPCSVVEIRSPQIKKWLSPPPLSLSLVIFQPDKSNTHTLWPQGVSCGTDLLNCLSGCVCVCMCGVWGCVVCVCVCVVCLSECVSVCTIYSYKSHPPTSTKLYTHWHTHTHNDNLPLTQTFPIQQTEGELAAQPSSLTNCLLVNLLSDADKWKLFFTFSVVPDWGGRERFVIRHQIFRMVLTHKCRGKCAKIILQ